MQINMNEKCKVRLTSTGEEIYKNYYNELTQWFPEAAQGILQDSKSDKDGYMEFQIWELFQIFGSSIHMGMGEVPFVDNVIII